MLFGRSRHRRVVNSCRIAVAPFLGKRKFWATFGSTFGDVLAPQISTIASDVAPKAILQVFGESSAYGAGFQVVREGVGSNSPTSPDRRNMYHAGTNLTRRYLLRRSADDGKRLGLSESALDVACSTES